MFKLAHIALPTNQTRDLSAGRLSHVTCLHPVIETFLDFSTPCVYPEHFLSASWKATKAHSVFKFHFIAWHSLSSSSSVDYSVNPRSKPANKATPTELWNCLEQANMALLALYAKLPLQSDSWSIRLLDLDPVPGRMGYEEIPLTGRLRVASLSTSPKLNALSYVWGKSGHSHEMIVCNGVAIPLTSNCFNALHTIRRIYGPVTIWVDSMCINQEDNAEKSGQLAFMSYIYTWAQAVYIWLGEGTNQTDRAISDLMDVTVATSYLLDSSWMGTPRLRVLAHANQSIFVVKVICFLLRRSFARSKPTLVWRTHSPQPKKPISVSAN